MQASTINRCLYVHAYTHARKNRRKLRASFQQRYIRSRKTGDRIVVITARSFQVSALIPHRIQRGDVKRKLWKASPVERLSVIGNIRRRMCSLPRPWPTWPVSDSISPACAASRSTGTTCPIPREVPRP